MKAHLALHPLQDGTVVANGRRRANGHPFIEVVTTDYHAKYAINPLPDDKF